MDIMQVCKDLYEKWKDFSYGIPVDGKIQSGSAEWWEKNYRLLSPEEFVKYHGGVCWDYVEFGRDYLSKIGGIPFHQFYIVTDTPDYDTHTFIVCRNPDDSYVYVESSFKKVADMIGGYKRFEHLDDILDLITTTMFDYNGNEKLPEFKYDVLTFEGHPPYGSTCKEYMEWMNEHGEMVRQRVAKNPRFITEGSVSTLNSKNNFSKNIDGMNIHLRPATEKDAMDMYTWEMESIDDNMKQDKSVQDNIREDVQSSIKDTAMIMCDDKTIGMFTACMIDNGEFRYIGELYIIESYRGHGIGTAILEHEIETYDKIKLQVAYSNINAITLYKSLGFNIIESNDNTKMYVMLYDKENIINESFKSDVLIKNKELYRSDKVSTRNNFKRIIRENIIKQDNSILVDLAEKPLKNTEINFDKGVILSSIPEDVKEDTETFNRLLNTIKENYPKYISYKEAYDKDPYGANEFSFKRCQKLLTDTNERLISKFSKSAFEFKDVNVKNSILYNEATKYIANIVEKMDKARANCVKKELNSIRSELGTLLGVKDPNMHPIRFNCNIPFKMPDNDKLIGKYRVRVEFLNHQYKPYNDKSNTIFIHISRNSLTELNPSNENQHQLGQRWIYIDNLVHLWAIKRGSLTDEFISHISETYGNHIYMYKPKMSDKFIEDSTEKSFNNKSITPVIIRTDNPLPVTEISKNKLLELVNSKTINEYAVFNEGAWNDIRRGVHPHSKKLMFHISTKSDLDEKEMKPQIPSYITDGGEIDPKYPENTTTERICVSPSIEGCLVATISTEKLLNVHGQTFYVYTPEKPFTSYKHKTNKDIIKDKDVFDANLTGESWILEPCKMKLYGTIKVDQVPKTHRKSTVNKDIKMWRHDFKWGWVVKPGVLKESFTEDDANIIQERSENYKTFKDIKEKQEIFNINKYSSLIKKIVKNPIYGNKKDQYHLNTINIINEMIYYQYPEKEIASVNNYIVKLASDLESAQKNNNMGKFNKLRNEILNITGLNTKEARVVSDIYINKNPYNSKYSHSQLNTQIEGVTKTASILFCAIENQIFRPFKHTRYFHCARTPINGFVKPTHQAMGGQTYPSNRVYMVAWNNDYKRKPTPEILSGIIGLDVSYFYEYIPKQNDVFYIDREYIFSEDYEKKVFINTNKPLPVKDITEEIKNNNVVKEYETCLISNEEFFEESSKHKNRMKKFINSLDHVPTDEELKQMTVDRIDSEYPEADEYTVKDIDELRKSQLKSKTPSEFIKHNTGSKIPDKEHNKIIPEIQNRYNTYQLDGINPNSIKSKNVKKNLARLGYDPKTQTIDTKVPDPKDPTKTLRSKLTVDDADSAAIGAAYSPITNDISIPRKQLKFRNNASAGIIAHESGHRYDLTHPEATADMHKRAQEEIDNVKDSLMADTGINDDAYPEKMLTSHMQTTERVADTIALNNTSKHTMRNNMDKSQKLANSQGSEMNKINDKMNNLNSAKRMMSQLSDEDKMAEENSLKMDNAENASDKKYIKYRKSTFNKPNNGLGTVDTSKLTRENYSEALISNEEFFEEFVSSKHRNRMKKFLKEKNFVPNKNNPNRGMIDSDELDKNHKPKRIEFTIDDPLKSTGDSIQGGTINMGSKTLKQHPDISKSVFSHEVGHNIINNNRDMMDQSIKQINEILDNSGLRELMNSHGNSADEYIADIYSAQKNGIDKCIRTLEYMKSDHNDSKKGYAQLLKSIERDPYKYMVSRMTSKQQCEIIKLSKTHPWLKEFQGRGMTLWLRDRKVKNIESLIKSKLRLIRMIKEKAINKDGAEKYIAAIKENIEKLKDDLVNAKREIQDEKNRLRKLTEDVKEGVKKVAPDSESIKRELKTDVENLIKQNDQEMEFRIYIVKNFFDKIQFPKNVSESFTELALISNEQFFAEAKLSAEKRNELKDSDFGIPEERMFPLNDEEHVKQAVKMFKHCPDKYKSDLAYRILKKARQFKLDTSGWDSLKEFTNQEVLKYIRP